MILVGTGDLVKKLKEWTNTNISLTKIVLNFERRDLLSVIDFVVTRNDKRSIQLVAK